MLNNTRCLVAGCLFFAVVVGQALGCSSERQRTTPAFDEFRSAIFKAGLYSGGLDNLFELVGRHTLAASIENGLLPQHKVRDIGAGSLRVGWWIVQFIDPTNYHAIEPVRARLDRAAEILGVYINLYYNDDFEFPSVQLDFVIARSIWTQTSKAMISKMLAEFVENSGPGAKFLTSVLFARSAEEDYQGEV